MPHILNLTLLVAEAAIFFLFMAVLFRWRARLGLGVFTCTLATLHFLETYLASAFYVATPFGILSPGSSVLFSGKLMMLLLIYIKEDVASVRQPIYGILAGNILTLLLAYLLRLHDVAILNPASPPQIGFIETMSGLMVWGTTLLFIDSIALVLIYERFARALRHLFVLRVFLALAIVLAIDQIGFYLALRWFLGVPIEAFYSGLIGKIFAALIFAVFAGLYMRFVEREDLKITTPLSNVLQELTYQERFEQLLGHTGRDRTTLLLNGSSFTTDLSRLTKDPATPGEPLNLVLIEVDATAFDEIEQRLGRENSEALLRTVARVLEGAVHDGDEIYRLGRRQFALICNGTDVSALRSVDKARSLLVSRSEPYSTVITLSVGIASRDETNDSGAIFNKAEKALTEARLRGGNQTVMASYDHDDVITSRLAAAPAHPAP